MMQGESVKRIYYYRRYYFYIYNPLSDTSYYMSHQGNSFLDKFSRNQPKVIWKRNHMYKPAREVEFKIKLFDVKTSDLDDVTGIELHYEPYLTYLSHLDVHPKTQRKIKDWKDAISMGIK